MAQMTAAKFLVEVENRLGWVPEGKSRQPGWKTRQVEIAKLTNAMAKYQVTFEDLQLALAFSQQRKQPVASPAVLCTRVQAAKEVAVAKPSGGVDDAVQQAIEWEMEHDLADSDRWIFRLVRTVGPSLELALQEWSEARDERLNFG